MGVEIERKFLVKNTWPRENGTLYIQGYLSRQKERTVRVRVVGDKGYLTIKGKNQKASRPEYEYAIPAEEAKEMLEQLCEKPIICKYRYKVLYENTVWEIDQFLGENEGLIVAEVELESEDQMIDLPPWIGQEVTDDTRYYNANLIGNPYQKWEKKIQ
ncbi:MAG TPA: adenylate cyclase [Sulfurovum sp. UBA12169]|nr:MAG TPA: adenylate cyclase [Sulfurovum sp. UBA12169]